MSKLEMVRAALLAMAGAAFLTLNFVILCMSPAQSSAVDPLFEIMAGLQVELTLVIGGLVFWPGRRVLRFVLGGFVLAIIWLATALLVGDFLLYQPTLATRLMVGTLMILCFSLPCSTCFLLSRWISQTRLILFHHRAASVEVNQFGLRHLLIVMACFSLVALAARQVFPNSLTGQFVLSVDSKEYSISSLIFLFPGLLVGPVALVVMRPTWRAIWILPWVAFLIACELVFVYWVDFGTLTKLPYSDMLAIAAEVGRSYLEVSVGVVVACLFARVGGLKLVKAPLPDPQSHLR